jgi:hypothetical protein
VRNITVSVEDEVYRQARIKAATWDTSVSALVKGFLIQLTLDENTRTERPKSGETGPLAARRADRSKFKS